MYFLPFIITFILLAVNLINGDVDSNYRACSALFSCGKIKNVGYPFWGGNRPQICGIPDFKLNCDSNNKNYPTINLAHNGLVTLNVSVIDRSSQVIFVSLENVVQKCHLFNTKNVSLLPNLKLAKDYKILYLYYGCAGCATKYHPNYPLYCSNDDGTTSSAYYFGGTSAPSVASDRTGNKSLCSCNNKIRVAVHKDKLDELRSGKVNLSYIFKAPIRMEYSAKYEACSNCLESGGRCGSSPPSDEFVCYCRNGPHSSACPGRRRIAVLLIGASIGASLLGIATLVVHVIWKNPYMQS